MKDLTKGNVTGVILQFAIPIFFMQILQIAYSFVDLRMVGEFLGEGSLAAVGATTPLNTLIIGLMTGLTNGFAVITAKFFGAKDLKNLKKCVAATFTMAVTLSISLSVLSLLLIRTLLNCLHTPKEIFDEAIIYISILIGGMIITAFYNAMAGILRAIGDTLTPLVFLAISAVLNIFGDYLFMAVFKTGVEGAAIATLLAQLIAAVACMIYGFSKYEILHFPSAFLHVDKNLALQMLASGFSMGLMNSIVSLGTVSLQSAINTFGSDIIVAHSAARKITELFMMIFGVFGMTMATFCSQNMGAGKIDRIKKGLLSCIFMACVWSTIMAALAWVIGTNCIHVVTGSDNNVILSTGALYLRVDTLFYYVPAAICIIRNAMQGFGDHITPIISSFIELVGKVLVVILLVPHFKYWAIIFAEPIVWILMVIPLIIRLFTNPVLKETK